MTAFHKTRLKSTNTYDSGFYTLVELLVVASILALLMSLLQTSLKKVFSTAQSTQCKNNLKGIGTAMNTYAYDCNEVIPPIYIPWNYSSTGKSDGWMKTTGLLKPVQSLVPYLSQTTSEAPASLCPTDMQPKQLKDNWLPVSYLYNTDYHNTSISDWTSPSQILNLDRNGEVYPYMGLKPWLNVFDMASARHNNAANALFTDFHVENLILPEITEELIRKPK